MPFLPEDRPGTLEKALKINLAHTIYGTFAEIGAGQEIANWFFRAGGASGTVAKTMSAYDMIISDEIYGKCSRYVSRQRMCDMLGHEYPMLIQRLNAKRGTSTTFFTLADTVRAKSYRDTKEECHGWLGLRFQAEPCGPSNDIQLHVRLLDDSNARQSDALGILGVNLLYAAFQLRDDLPAFLHSLLDDLTRKRVEIDMIDFSGPAFAASEFQDRLVALKLVRLGLADAALFGADGEIWQAADVLYKKPVFLKRGSFDPITRLNLDMIARGQAAFQADFGDEARDNIEILEITMHNLLASGAEVPDSEFLARADILQALGKNVLISRYPEFHRVSSYLARHTQCPIGIVLGLPLFQELFNERWSADLEGGLLEAFGRLFKNQVRVYVYPMGDPMTGQILSVNDARVTSEQKHLLRYLIETNCVRALEEPNQDFLFHTSAEVRNMIHARDPQWQSLVPDIVLQQGPWKEIATPAM
ncbi:MAG: TonB-dependent receptor [Prosthecobacter sp.]|uniref:TonB-dependent receptor n=1 Tax=Prosthecobacter sp. TaxID=1965333 RepID=UPI0038FF8F70